VPHPCQNVAGRKVVDGDSRSMRSMFDLRASRSRASRSKPDKEALVAEARWSDFGHTRPRRTGKRHKRMSDISAGQVAVAQVVRRRGTLYGSEDQQSPDMARRPRVSFVSPYLPLGFMRYRPALAASNLIRVPP
jgi:hypothetical protein